MSRIYIGMVDGQREMVVANNKDEANDTLKAMGKDLTMAGKKVLLKWNSEVYEIIHEVWGKYVIKNIKDSSMTRVEKDEVILIYNM